MSFEAKHHPDHPSTESSGGRKRKKIRKRMRISGSDPELRKARKLREKWTHRRQAVQLRVLVVAAVVFLIMFVVSLVDILTDNFEIPFVYDVLIGLAILSLMVWGVFKLIERFHTVRYRKLSSRKKKATAAS